MKQPTILLLLFLLSAFRMHAQELTVKSITVAPGDLTASVNPRNDRNGNPCGLVKVRLAAQGATFDGNIIGNVEYKTGEYWVYMTQGSYLLQVKHPNFLPLDISFRDHGVQGVEAKTTYVLTLLSPSAQEKKQTLVLNYSPANAMVLIDSKPVRGNGRVERDLPLGQHSYVIAADGYIAAEGTVKLNGGAPREITEKLAKDSASDNSQLNQQPSEEQEPATPSVYIDTSTPGKETITVNGVSFNMVRVEGGTFQMGATKEMKDPFVGEKPVHQVTLSSYSIGETEVTQELWEAVMGSNPSYFKGAKLPVEQVSWDDCQDFIRKLNALTGRTFRLPTEAEWEFAARGGNKSRGHQYSGGDDLDRVAWYDGNSGSKTHNVGTKQPNELGLYDMSGNVWEWCLDWYGKYSRRAQTNPKGPSSGSRRVIRGGGWFSYARFCRSSYRFNYSPSYRYFDLGLRLAF